MSYALNSLNAEELPERPRSPIEDLLDSGISREDIDVALLTQQAQRRCGVPILSLRRICGLDDSAGRSMVGPRYDSARTLTATEPLKVKRHAGKPHITRNPVWANSVQEGSPAEADFKRPFHATDRKKIVHACYRTFEHAKKLASDARTGKRDPTEEERKLIGFTASCRDILIKMADHAEHFKGNCTPAYETIMQWTSLSYSTVYRSINILADLGFIEWIRRFTYIKDEYLGARSTQTSNLYRFHLPAWLGNLLGISPPVPDDHVARRESDLENHATMLAELPKNERRRLWPIDPTIQRALIAAGLRAGHKADSESKSQEYQKEIEPKPIYIKLGYLRMKRPSRSLNRP